MKQKLFLFLILFSLSLLPLVSSYQVNSPLDIKVKLQYDDGVNLTDVLSTACIASIYFAGDSSLVVRDATMTPGTYHEIIFTPTAAGDYTISIKCTYGNSTVTYHEEFPITQMIVGSQPASSGGQVLNLNVKILPEKKLYIVNLQENSKLLFPIQYSVGGKLSNSNQATWRLVREDKVLSSGFYKILSTGNYQFDYDFKDQLPGSYQLFLDFDGRTEIVDVSVTSMGQGVSLISGMVTGSDGKLSIVRVTFSILFILLLIMAIVLLWRRSRKQK